MSDNSSSVHDSSLEFDLESSISRSTSIVSFSTIEIRTHALILGQNPSMSGGPSLEIDWDSQQRLIVDLEEYENSRPPRRLKQQLHMPSLVRENVLLSSGYSKNQIDNHVRCVVEKERRSVAFSRSKRIMGNIMSKTRRMMAKVINGRLYHQ